MAEYNKQTTSRSAFHIALSMPPMDLLEGLLRDFIATTKRKRKNKEMIYNKTQRTHCETKRKPRQTTKKNTKKDDSARSRNFLLDHSFRNVEVVVCDGYAPPKDRTAKAEATRQRISNDDDGNVQWIDSMTIAIMMETRVLSVMVLPAIPFCKRAISGSALEELRFA